MISQFHIITFKKLCILSSAEMNGEEKETPHVK